jgi:Rrf2 family protein
MSTALRISEAASLAFHAMALLAANPGEMISTSEIASTLKVSEAHLSKVLQRLTKVGLVKSIRGPGGGFKLAKRRDRITLLDVFESMEGRLELSDCLLAVPACSGDRCMFGGLLDSVNSQLINALAKKKLSQVDSISALNHSRT